MVWKHFQDNVTNHLVFSLPPQPVLSSSWFASGMHDDGLENAEKKRQQPCCSSDEGSVQMCICISVYLHSLMAFLKSERVLFESVLSLVYLQLLCILVLLIGVHRPLFNLLLAVSRDRKVKCKRNNSRMTQQFVVRQFNIVAKSHVSAAAPES